MSKERIFSFLLNKEYYLNDFKFYSLIFQLGLVIDLTNTTRYYSTIDLKKEGIKHVKVSWQLHTGFWAILLDCSILLT